jgi:hypothetical protein
MHLLLNVNAHKLGKKSPIEIYYWVPFGFKKNLPTILNLDLLVRCCEIHQYQENTLKCKHCIRDFVKFKFAETARLELRATAEGN